MGYLLSYFALPTEENTRPVHAFLYYGLLAYCVSLFIKDAPVITNVLAAVILVASLFSHSPSSYFKRLFNSPVATGIIVFFLLNTVSALLSENKAGGVAVLQMRLPLLILPLAIALLPLGKRSVEKILLFYAAATTAASIAGFLHGAYMARQTGDTGYLYNDNLSWIIDKQAVYFAFYVTVALFIFIYHLLKKDKETQRLKMILWLSCGWLLFIMIMLASKTAIFSLALILMILLYTWMVRNRKILEGTIITIGIIAVSFLAVKVFPKISNRFKGLTEMSFTYDNPNAENHFNAEYDASKWNSTNTRVALWSCAWEVFRNNMAFGTGVGDRYDALMAKYKEKNFIYAHRTEKHTHNQYLEAAVSMGIAGLAAFLYCFVIGPLIFAKKHRNMLCACVTAALALCFLTENMLDRYMGEILIAFILPLTAALSVHPQAPPAVDPGSRTGTY